MKIEQQLKGLHDSFERALAVQDWDVLAQLDSKLQRAIPKIRQQPLTQAEKLQLQKLNALYDTMIAAGEREKAHIQQQINQQASNQEGMHAYLQHQK
ncbi:hypothetical protein [uncultured Photobacterium sp.]|uniref:hypothetical protein n=1 Tax=uncultured Photobacterium sp. TaxID=173973 RepID=UPI002619B44C|nr:hypothetical protein [uncultured Photobacterium sp.]